MRSRWIAAGNGSGGVKMKRMIAIAMIWLLAALPVCAVGQTVMTGGHRKVVSGTITLPVFSQVVNNDWSKNTGSLCSAGFTCSITDTVSAGDLVVVGCLVANNTTTSLTASSSPAETFTAGTFNSKAQLNFAVISNAGSHTFT